MYIHDFAAAATAAVNEHNPTAVVALWAEPADYLSPLTGPQNGLEALRRREESLFGAFSDLRTTITPLGQDGHTGAMLVRFDGTHDGPYAGMPATGNTIALEMVAIVDFDDDGKVIGERVMLDTADVAAALG
ncbi:ester cyclase [Gordonia sp. DT30]|uniref:ester cyclase n=1 Tax=unclassified Gordonia (in: high G+C Gram-positive bacteria) TaxID=2657482 RepID=UPI003CF01194